MGDQSLCLRLRRRAAGLNGHLGRVIFKGLLEGSGGSEGASSGLQDSVCGPGNQAFMPTPRPPGQSPLKLGARRNGAWCPHPHLTPLGKSSRSSASRTPAAEGPSPPSSYLFSAQESQDTSQSLLVNLLELRDGGLFQDHTPSWKRTAHRTQDPPAPGGRRQQGSYKTQQEGCLGSGSRWAGPPDAPPPESPAPRAWYLR